jgi:hypothetical protein
MGAPPVSALLSAAGYLSTAADDLRRAGCGGLAEEIDRLIVALDLESALCRTQARWQPGRDGEA